MCLRAKYAHLRDDSHLGEGSRRRVFQRIKWMQDLCKFASSSPPSPRSYTHITQDASQAHMLVFFLFACHFETGAISLALRQKKVLYLASSSTRDLTVRKLINSRRVRYNDEKCSHLLCSHRWIIFNLTPSTVSLHNGHCELNRSLPIGSVCVWSSRPHYYSSEKKSVCRRIIASHANNATGKYLRALVHTEHKQGATL
jgi:hypothetical protein